jgi:hypothetical protein
MATRKATSRSRLKRGTSRKKSAARKSSMRKASSHRRSGRSSNGLFVGDSYGHVYLFSESGVKRSNSHVAKKASARAIRTSIGLSKKQESGAKSLLNRLEREGLITRS